MHFLVRKSNDSLSSKRNFAANLLRLSHYACSNVMLINLSTWICPGLSRDEFLHKALSTLAAEKKIESMLLAALFACRFFG